MKISLSCTIVFVNFTISTITIVDLLNLSIHNALMDLSSTTDEQSQLKLLFRWSGSLLSQ